MTVFQVVIVMRTKDVGWNDTGKLISVLISIAPKIQLIVEIENKRLPIRDINHTLSVGITKVRIMWRTIVNHGFINRIRSLVGENASGQAGDYFADFEFVRIMDDIVINQKIITE